MKRISIKPPPLPTPRIDSLRYRLDHASNQDDQPYLDQLMIFLDDPPPGTRDRWSEGAKMCSDWGIPCTKPSVWRLYRSYALEWRLRLAQQANQASVASPDSLDQRAEQLVALRTLELLSNPQSAPTALVGLFRLGLRKKALEFARQKHQDNKRRKLDLAIDALSEEIRKDPVARASFQTIIDILHPNYETEDSQP